MIGIVRCFFPSVSNDGIGLCATGIEVHFHYHLVLRINWEYFNALKCVRCIEKSAVGQVFTFIKSVITEERSLVSDTECIRHD